MKKQIEVVIPCLNEEACIELIYQEIHRVAKKTKDYTISILYVDDGSTDATLEKIKEVCSRAEPQEVHYISFARNFGKEAAIYAGLSNSSADYLALMDADLQHPPELLVEMIQGIEEGYECCGARRVNRNGEPRLRSAFSDLFYRVISRVTAIQMKRGMTDYQLMTRKYVNAVLEFRERDRFTKGIFSWIGFPVKWVEYENVERAAGNTKWSFSSLLRYAVNGMMSFAATPLRGAVYTGFFVMFLAFIYGIRIFLAALTSDGVRNGYASLMFVLLMLGSIIILLLGLIGEYLARIYMEVKKRPIYISKEEKLGMKEGRGNEKNIDHHSCAGSE